MFTKERKKSKELKILQALDHRMILPEKEKLQLVNLVKGLEGEIELDRWLGKLEIDCLILNDLLFEMNNTHFQIDSLLITEDTIYAFDAKNYEGEFYYEGGRLKTLAGNEVKDPLLQLRRSETLMRQMLKSINSNLSLEAYDVFTNPEFTLWQAPLNQPIILPTKINRFMKKINNKHSRLNSNHKKLAEKLMSLNLPESPYIRLPSYEYDQLEKGIHCGTCQFPLRPHKGRTLICENCSTVESTESAVLRAVDEFRLLFPKKKITTSSIHEWCNFIVSRKIIQRILMNYLHLNREGKMSYYD
ncbi:nuclease-related domain-containing protein [Bacillus sp. REN3]|uniref:nuclease-related domain-containing protein n=1 Tax=Bacillus sp. REN3 TaxID=2802440 RepID=UPI001AEE9B8B|nr:nuclease-related domain-containing protein [Bacillus sp. REN3]